MINEKIPLHRSGGRQTAAFLQQIEVCGFLPRSQRSEVRVKLRSSHAAGGGRKSEGRGL